MRLRIFGSALFVMFALCAQAADEVVVPAYEDELMRLRVLPRSVEQMAAFFEARGFPVVMIDELSRYCFFTVVLKNKSRDVVWLDMSQWRFVAGEQELERIPRSRWPEQWAAMQIPLSAQSTFRWTLLPERLDFQADESEGGNVIVARTDRPFSLIARFALGPAGEKGMRVARIDNLACGPVPGEKRP